MTNINFSFFDGIYKDIWRLIIPPEMTIKETEFILEYFQLNESSIILDLMCGYGRNAISLAQHGISVTAVDNQSQYIEELEKIRLEKSLPILPLQKNILEFSSTASFDLAICMGNSLNFFSEIETNQLLKNVYDLLKCDGCFLFHSWSIAEIAYLNFKSKSWGSIGETKLLSDSKIKFQPSRIESESTMINKDGEIEVKHAVDYIYSISEYERLLKLNGFVIDNMFSIPGKKNFEFGDSRIYMIAKKNVKK